MDETVYRGKGHGLIREDLAPFTERLIGGDEHRSPLVAGADQLEQNAGLGLILGHIGEIVQNQQMIFVEFGDRRFECEITARDLEFCTRSVVLVNNTRQPFSTRAMPSAAARCDLPPPGGPKHKRLAPFSSQASPAAMAAGSVNTT